MNIFIAAGASGGHVFPALLTANRLKEEGHQISFLTTSGLTKRIIEKWGFRADTTCAKGFLGRGFIYFLRSSALMVKAIISAFLLIGKTKADIIVGFGGYAAFPGMAAGALSGIPVLLHEQNVIPGKANRLAAIFSKKIAISFRESQKYFSRTKTVLTGCPCRCEKALRTKEELYQKFGLKKDVATILVLGGSQGSHKINKEFLTTTVLLKGSGPFQFIHICGEADYEFLLREYAKSQWAYCLYPFIDDIEEAYTIADIVIARSGAVTVCELMAFKKQSILIPYPYAEAHQKANASLLTRIGVAKVIDEGDFFASRLKSEIINMLVSRLTEEDIARRVADHLFVDATESLVKQIYQLKK